MRRRRRASARATYAPVIEAVRVPPSAWMTSQSSHSVRGPSNCRLVTARRLRPMSRWISWVRPPTRPRADSRGMRVGLEPGNIPYSAVTHPCAVSRRNGGTCSSTVAVQMTRVSPSSMRTEPCACRMKSVVILTGRSCPALRPSVRMRYLLASGRFITIRLGFGQAAPVLEFEVPWLAFHAQGCYFFDARDG